MDERVSRMPTNMAENKRSNAREKRAHETKRKKQD
jgi:hypothetical protein